MGNPYVAPAVIMTAAGGATSTAKGFRGRKQQRRQQGYTRDLQSAQHHSAFKLQEHQQIFQNAMDDTKYQRGVKDMRAAGLNPMMMYGGGQGLGGSASAGGIAGTAGGSGAPGQGDIGNPEAAMASAMQFGLQRKQFKIQKQLANKQLQKEQSIIDLNKSQTKIKEHDLDMYKLNNLPSGQQMPQALKWLNTMTGKSSNPQTPGGGKKGKWIKSQGQLYNISTSPGRKGFLNSLSGDNRKMWEKALKKKYGGI